jgi:formiminotetrahydrofolate cyclodeaminase
MTDAAQTLSKGGPAMADQLLTLPVSQLLDELASSAPVPGGGSVAGLTGAMAAGLVSMVCNLTLGKKKFADVEEEIQRLLGQAEELRAELQTLTDEDAAAFRRLSAAYKLPRETPSDIAIRQDAIQAATRVATEVPLRIARAAAAVLPLCRPTAEKGNSAAVSDVGVAVLLAQAAIRSALLNVQINLNVLQDAIYVRETRAAVDDLTAGLDEELAAISAVVQEKLQG